MWLFFLSWTNVFAKVFNSSCESLSQSQYHFFTTYIHLFQFIACENLFQAQHYFFTACIRLNRLLMQICHKNVVILLKNMFRYFDLVLMKVYLKRVIISLKNIFTCFDIRTTNISMTEDYYELLALSKINYRSLFAMKNFLRNLFENLLYFVYADFVIYPVYDILC